MNRSGIILIVLGCVFLAGNFGLLQWAWLRTWWPLLLIAAGVWSLMNPGRIGRRLRRREERVEQEHP